MSAHHLSLLWEGENEMQEQSRLQHSGGDVPPIDRPVEIVQLAGVLEGIGDKRNQAKDVEVRGPGSSPPAEQNVEADAQVDEGNQPQPIIERTLGRNQDDAGIERNGLPEQGIRGFRPDPVTVELAFQPRQGLDFLAVDGNELVAGLDATPGAGAAGVEPVSRKVSPIFDPPDTVVGNQELPLGLEIEAGKNDRSYRQKKQQDGDRANLAFPVHTFRRRSLRGPNRRGRETPPILDEQLRCHVVSHSGTAKYRV